LLSDSTQERIEERRAKGLPIGKETGEQARAAWQAARFAETEKRVEEAKERMGIL
jgi:hypothetical protein